IVDVVVAGAALPAWWQFRHPGACRQNAAGWSTETPSDAERCADWASGMAVGGFAGYKAGAYRPNSARIIGVSAVPMNGLAELSAGQQYLASPFVLRNEGTAGKGACGGCGLGACIGLRSIKLTTPKAENDLVLTQGLAAGDANDDRRAMWQGGAGVLIRS